MSKMHKIWLMAAAIPKTVVFNFRYLKFADAIKFPFIVSHRVRLQKLGGRVKLAEPARFNMVRLGFHENPAFSQKDRAVWFNCGTVIFKGTAYLGNGTCVANSGELTLGNNFQVSGNSRIVCKEKMSFGNNVLISWDCLFMDGDAHTVYDISPERSGGGDAQSSVPQNGNRPVMVDDHVWIGARVMVSKGVHIAKNCVIAANSGVIKSIDTPNCVAGGYPAQMIRENINWKG